MAASATPPLPAEMVEVVVHAMEHRHPHVHLHLVVDMGRRFDHPDLVRALHGLVEAFPVLGCRYQPGWWRDRWVRWEGDRGELCHVEETNDLEAATRSWVQRSIRYLEEPTVRVAFFTASTGGRLVLTLHHMVADGGGIKAAGAVFVSLLCGVEPNPPPSQDRSLMSVARSLGVRDIPILLREMLHEGLLPLSSMRVRRLDYGIPRGSGAPDPHWQPVRLTGDKARHFVAATTGQGATINDALVATVARMAARRAKQGPVMVAYTVDLRRYLREKRAQVTNLAGVSMVVLGREVTRTTSASLRAVSVAIGEQKKRLTGVAYALLPGFTLGWLPHGLLRWSGQYVISQVLRRFDRTIAMTNIGALDECLAPLGDDAVEACIVGPFIHGIQVPLITVTGFRGELTLNVGATGIHDRQDLANFACELEGALRELSEG